MHSETQIPAIMRHEFGLFRIPEGNRNYEPPIFRKQSLEQIPVQEMPRYRIVSDGRTVSRVPYIQ